MMTYVKRFVNTKAADVRREATLLNIAASYGLAPEVYDTDNKTYIEMEDLETMNIGDMWGNDIKHIPQHIVAGMFSILWHLYYVCGIEYLDVWPRNFIEVNNRVFIVDFGHAFRKRKKCNRYLQKMLNSGRAISRFRTVKRERKRTI